MSRRWQSQLGLLRASPALCCARRDAGAAGSVFRVGPSRSDYSPRFGTRSKLSEMPLMAPLPAAVL